MNPIGIVISNGLGDRKLCEQVIETTCELVKTKIPILGICLGLQILTLCLGGETYKLKFGYRGENHTCIDVKSKRVYITS